MKTITRKYLDGHCAKLAEASGKKLFIQHEYNYYKLVKSTGKGEFAVTSGTKKELDFFITGALWALWK